MFEKYSSTICSRANEIKETFKFFRCFKRLSGCEPKRVAFHLTFKCNLKCVMCELWRFSKENEQMDKGMSTSQIFSVLDELGTLGTKHIHFSGGEATLRKDFNKILEHASSIGFEISLNTNGTTMTRTLAREIMGNNVTSVILSLDSASPDTHDNIRGVPGSWQKTVAGIKKLGDARRELGKKTEIRINYVLMKENYRNSDKILDLRKDIEFDTVFFLPMVTYDNIVLFHTESTEKDFSSLNMDYSDIMYFNKNILPSITKKAKFYGLKEEFIKPQHLFGESEEDVEKYLKLGQSRGFYEKHHCFIPSISSEILPSGDVIPCCISPIFDDTYTMGNVYQKSFSEIWDGAKYMEFRKRCRFPTFPMCQHCMAEYRNVNERIMETYESLPFSCFF